METCYHARSSDLSPASHLSLQISDTQIVMITCEAARLPAFPVSTICYLGEPLPLAVGRICATRKYPGLSDESLQYSEFQGMTLWKSQE